MLRTFVFFLSCVSGIMILDVFGVGSELARAHSGEQGVLHGVRRGGTSGNGPAILLAFERCLLLPFLFECLCLLWIVDLARTFPPECPDFTLHLPDFFYNEVRESLFRESVMFCFGVGREGTSAAGRKHDAGECGVYQGLWMCS